MDELQGKVAVVTGAASGIGRSLATAFAGEGMRLFLADLDEPGLRATADDLHRSGADVVVATCDVSDGQQIEALARQVIEAFGAVHLVCNNAGVGGGGAVADFDVDNWKHVIDVDLWSVLHGMRVFLPLLIEQGEGHIVNTASVAGLFAGPFMGPYSVAKYGVVAISEAAFLEQATLGTGVGVSVLCPGWVRTPIADNMPLSGDGSGIEAILRDTVKGFVDKGMDPDEVAAAVVDAVRTRRFYILTHDDSRIMVRRRLEAIVNDGDPPNVSMDTL